MSALFLTTMLGIIAAQLAPGPNLLAVASVALADGRRAGIAVAAGVATGVVIWALSFATGISQVLDIWPASLRALQLLGGSYFLYISLRSLRSAWRGTPSSIAAARQRRSPLAAWRRGLVVVLTNPKAALMWAAVSAFLAGSGAEAASILALAPAASLSALLIYGTYAIIFSAPLAVRGYRRAGRAFEWAFGSLFGAFGVRLLWDGIRG